MMCETKVDSNTDFIQCSAITCINPAINENNSIMVYFNVARVFISNQNYLKWLLFVQFLIYIKLTCTTRRHVITATYGK